MAKSGHPCLILGIRGNTFSFSLLVWNCGDSHVRPLLYWYMFPLYPLPWHVYHKWILNSLKSFFCIYWDDHVILFFNLLMFHIDLWILKNLCILGIHATWSWCVSLWIYCWIWLATILLRIFASICINDTDLYFSVFVISLV